MKSGIYKIFNTETDKCYIGSSKNLRVRKNAHFWALSKNKHHNSHLQNSFNRYGEENFLFTVLEYVDDINKLKEKEQEWIDKFPDDKLYNIAKTSNYCPSSRVLDDEQKRAISAMMKYKWEHDDEFQYKIYLAHTRRYKKSKPAKARILAEQRVIKPR